MSFVADVVDLLEAYMGVLTPLSGQQSKENERHGHFRLTSEVPKANRNWPFRGLCEPIKTRL